MDTETTWFGADARVIQFSGIYGLLLPDGSFIEERRINQYIKIDEEIPEAAFNVHGISKEKLAPFNYIESYIPELMEYYGKADLAVGHNISFDVRMMEQEMKRCGFIPNWKWSPSIFCTMKDVPWYSKWPTLKALYNDLFWKDFEWSHDSMCDVEATRDCFLKLLADKKISI